MNNELSYLNYVGDDAHMSAYAEYQKKYAQSIRESDKVLIDIIRNLADEELRSSKNMSLLDLGCSTGNLLLHVKHALPGLKLFGGDVVSSIINDCQANPNLQGVEFAEMDMLNLELRNQFDFVVTNAALMFFDDDEFDQAVHNISTATKPGGWFVAFDLFHPFEEEITIIETSRSHPQGLKFAFRSYKRVRASLEKAGFLEQDFRSFAIPIDLPRPQDASDIGSYTVQTADHTRMCFRGTLFQPWCHLIARKEA